MRTRRWLFSGSGLLILTGLALAGGVTKTTVTVPASTGTFTAASPIGVTVKSSGPLSFLKGGFASTSSAILSIPLLSNAGSVDQSASATTTSTLTHTQTGHSHWGLLTTVIYGFSHTQGKTGNQSTAAFLGSNTLDYTITRIVDGVVTVPATGSKKSEVALSGPNGNSKSTKRLFESYASIVNFAQGTSIETKVTSTNAVTASSFASGLVNGQAVYFTFARKLF